MWRDYHLTSRDDLLRRARRMNTPQLEGVYLSATRHLFAGAQKKHGVVVVDATRDGKYAFSHCACGAAVPDIISKLLRKWREMKPIVACRKYADFRAANGIFLKRQISFVMLENIFEAKSGA